MKIEIRGGRLVDPVHGIDRADSLFIAAGRIAAVGLPPAGWHANRIIEAQELVVAPGFIDLAVRLREPGFEYKATLESEMQAAVAGGVTRLACPPDTDPPLDEPGLVEMLKHRARQLNQAHVHPIGALTVRLEGVDLTEMGELAEAGCIAFAQGNLLVDDLQVLMRAMQYAATFGYRVWLRPQEASLSRAGIAHDGEVATRLGLAPIPACAETIALEVIFALSRATGARVHLSRLSTAEGVSKVRAAKRSGLAVSADVAVHHLHLCDADIGWFDAQCRVEPPFRSASDRAALRQGLADGTIDLICSDHAPVDDDAKQVPFAEAETGVTAVELLLPLTLKWAQEEGIGLSAALARLTREPARVMGIDAGHLGVGQVADVCVFDPAARWIVDRAALKSQGKNTPFLGLEVEGKVRYTIVNGQVACE